MWWYGKNFSESYNPLQVDMRCMENTRGYDPAKGCTEASFDWPGDRSRFAHWEYDNKFFMYGGYSRYNNKIYDKFYELDIPKRNWTHHPYLCGASDCQPEEQTESSPICDNEGNYSRTCYPKKRSLSHYFERDGLLYLFGGEVDFNYVNKYVFDIFTYDPEIHMWNCISRDGECNNCVTDTFPEFNEFGSSGSETTIPGGRRGGAVWNIDEKVYFFGGYGVGEGNHIGYLMDTWMYDLDDKIFTFIPSSESTDYKKRHNFPSLLLASRECGNRNEPGYGYDPPCFRESAITWKHTGYLYLFGGFAQLYSSTDSDYPYYMPLYYNDLYRLDPLNWKGGNSWYFVGGKRIILEPGYMNFDIKTTATALMTGSFGNSDMIWPGGLGAANYIQFENFIFVTGGIGYGSTFHDTFPTSTKKDGGAYHCFHYQNDRFYMNSNSSCSMLNDMWIFDSTLLQWKFLGGDLNAQIDNRHWSDIYKDQGKYSETASPFGSAFGGMFSIEETGELGFFGGGNGRVFNHEHGKGIGDLWFLKFYSCDNIPWIFPSVCNGRGTCIQESSGTNLCDCYIGFSGDFCENLGEVTCNGIGKFTPGVCNSHGSCVTKDNCVCDTKWTEYWCSSCPTCTEEELNPGGSNDGPEFEDISDFNYGALVGGVVGGGVGIVCLCCCGAVFCCCCLIVVIVGFIIMLVGGCLLFGPYGYTILGFFGINPYDLGIEGSGEEDFEDFSDNEAEEIENEIKEHKRRQTVVGRIFNKFKKKGYNDDEYDGEYDEDGYYYDEDEGEYYYDGEEEEEEEGEERQGYGDEKRGDESSTDDEEEGEKRQQVRDGHKKGGGKGKRGKGRKGRGRDGDSDDEFDDGDVSSSDDERRSRKKKSRKKKKNRSGGRGKRNRSDDDEDEERDYTSDEDDYDDNRN